MHREYADRLLATTRPAVANAANDPQALLHAAYGAVIRGDYDAFGESLTEDAELNIAGFAPMNGTWRGRDEVVAATRKNFAEVEHQQPTIEGMISQGDCIAVLLRESGTLKSTGKAYSIRAVQWFTFADGKIKKIDELAASVWKVDG
jgi:ketosteroid isomerase-like protein